MKKLLIPLDFSNWRIRASSAGKIVGNPAGKTPLEKYEDCLSKIGDIEFITEKLTKKQTTDLEKFRLELPELELHKDDVILSGTCISYLKDVYVEKRYGIRKEIHSKYFESGKLREDDSILLISEVDDLELFENGIPIYGKCNLQRQFNEHCEGECDIRKDGVIQDVKSCWDAFTFQPHIEESNNLWYFDEVKNKWIQRCGIENDNYYWQGITYLGLYGDKIFKLRYCLVNMPEVLIDQERKKLLYQYGGETDEFLKAFEQYYKKCKFDDIPAQSKVATFTVNYDEQQYAYLCKKVEKCREWLNNYALECFYFENPLLRPAIVKSEVIVISETLAKTEKLVSEIVKNSEVVELESDKVISEPILPLNKCPECGGSFIDVDDFGYSCGECKHFWEENTNFEILESIRVETEYEKEFNFPNDLDTIEPEIKSDEVIEPEKSDDDFINKINEIKTSEQLAVFYMNNSDTIDDHEIYEPAFQAKKKQIKEKIEKENSPKVTKQPKEDTQKIPSPVKNTSVTTKEEKIEYTGNEEYEILDGVKSRGVYLFDAAKLKLREVLIEKLKSTTSVSECRDTATNIANLNLVLVKREPAFMSEMDNLVKSLCAEIIEKKKKQQEEEVRGL